MTIGTQARGATRPGRLGWALAGALALSGCGADDRNQAQFKTAEYAAYGPAPAAAARPDMRGEAQGDAAAAGGAEQGGVAAEEPKNVERKIIYNAQVDLNVADLSASESTLLTLVRDGGGYVSQTEVSGSPGTPRRGTWTVRVPVERFSALLAAVTKLGELNRTHTDSQDVSQEFYDVEARIKNKQQEEARLKKILEEVAGKLKEILEVEKEITRVRGEVEMMQGRLRFLGNLSSLSTITVAMGEVRKFAPAQNPTFAERIGRTFQGSVANLGEFLETILLAAVALAPWLVLIVPAGLVALLAWLRLRRRFGRVGAA